MQPRGSWQQVQPRGSWQQAQPRGGYAGRQYNSPPQRDRGYSDRHDDQRRYAAPRSYAPSYGYRGGSTYGYHGGYGAYRSYGHRSYAIPYGYRRHGRSGWSFNLYFGRPYGYYDGDAAYGYYAIAPGFAYGSVRIVDAPPDAQVFVDGYYAGVVDDYDGVFQHLNLVPGSHRIEIGVPGYAPIGVDVFIEPGQMITYRANMY